MRRLSSRIHGVLDYIVGIFLVLTPWLFGYVTVGAPETWLAIGGGSAVIVYSLLTDYELGVWRQLEFRAHLWLDGLVGFTLLIWAWLFAAAEWALWMPHLVAGVLLVVMPLLSEKEPQPRTRITESTRY